jgi:hypothetical protein
MLVIYWFIKKYIFINMLLFLFFFLVIDGKEIVFRNYIDISVAVATPTGLMVPVLRNAENLSFA